MALSLIKSFPATRPGRSCLLIAVLILAHAPAHANPTALSIVGSKHDLSVSGPGPNKASGEGEVCVFCHTPHGGSPAAPLWNRYDSGATYTPYFSSTIKAPIGQPTGSSRVCLSCHDGIIAMGTIRSRSGIGMDGSPLLTGRASLGTDLGNDHPVSFKYNSTLAISDGELQDPGALGPVKLDKQSMVQCTSCHEAHDNRFGKFLVMDNYASALCATCHDKKDWLQSSHRTSSATWNGLSQNPWPNTKELTVAGNACENCHAPHNGNGRRRLLTYEEEEENCYPCHNGNVAGKNIKAEFGKASIHNINATTGVHDPAEDLLNPPRHVECADCHNPHAANALAANAPNASGMLAKVRGLDVDGNPVTSIQYQYELCYRCHADSNERGTARVKRVVVQTNVKREFDPSNPSYHPVAAVGKNPDVPSLKSSSYTVNKQIYCTDCHNNDQGPGAGGSGPNGPHGAAWVPILERQLVTTDPSTESAYAYALCYKCHDRTSILNNESFRYHKEHIIGTLTVAVNAACSTCHDPHGARDNTHLINFNSDVVTRNPIVGGPADDKLEFIDDGILFAGTCSLTCHKHTHIRSSYAPGP